MGRPSSMISRGRAPHAGQVRQVADDRNRLPALALDLLLHVVELAAVAAGQDDGAMPGQFEGGLAAEAGGRAGDDVGLVA